MNLDKLYSILGETTAQFRKGSAVTKSELPMLDVTEIYMIPHESDANPNIEKVDLHFVTIGVDKETAELRRGELIALLNDYPDPTQLAGGPSYIAVGGVIGDQGAAFQLFALGKVLGIWDIITPATFGMTGEQANQAAGAGYIMCTGYRPEQLAA